MKLNKNKEHMNKRVIAHGIYKDNNSWLTQINNNDLIIGASGSGKTRGYVIPNIARSNHSMIIGDTKGNLHNLFKDYLEQEGYKVMNLNFKDLQAAGQSGYNPLNYIRYNEKTRQYNEQDIYKVASIICPITVERDPFWEKSAMIYIAILISYVLEESPKSHHNLFEVLDLYNTMTITNEKMPTKFEILLKDLVDKKPDCLAARLSTEITNARKVDRTYNSIKMVVSEKLQLLTIDILAGVYNNKNMIDISNIGKEKTAVFLTISDVDRSLDSLVSLFYTQCFNVLIDTADKEPNSRLKIPVRLILDDFASNCNVPDFDNIMSVIRSREIYASIILQSTSQLEDIYGLSKAKTIINNCDVVLYLGGQDLTTANFISQRINKPVHSVLNLQLDKCYVLTRGESFVERDKYDLEKDANYIALQHMNAKTRKCHNEITYIDYEENETEKEKENVY